MASAFKNAGQQNPTTDDATADVYTAPSNGTAVLHAVYISNTNASSEADIDVKVTIDGGTTYRTLLPGIKVPQNNAFILDKPVNLEANDKIRVVSNISGTETFISVLENT
jgi:hypothetical protein|tara:strand:+ start:278 stop:607 length:330 start_codon:yes stop_codon:yes gene_type:complete